MGKKPEKYNLTLDFKGAKEIPSYSGAYEKINDQKYKYKSYFTEGSKKSVYGKGSIFKDNYVFRGWYWSNGITETQVFDSSGEPIPNTVLGNGEQIFDEHGNYVRKSGTELYAKYYATTTIKYHAENEKTALAKNILRMKARNLQK